jgi:ribonucleoside-diphosphate reductase alpha chain
LGLKALAIYRDNCKVGQPLSASNKNHGEKSADASAASESAVQAATVPVVTGPVRRRLPKKRPSQTVSFTVGGAEGYLTTGSYPDDGLGEVFIKLGKQGSTLAGVMDAFSIAVSVGLQYGIPLESYVAKFTNLRFEPAGMTDDPDVRIATSVMDYLFRRIALDYLPTEARAELGIFSAAERVAQVSASYGSDNPSDAEHLVEDLRTTVDATPVIRPAVESGTVSGSSTSATGPTSPAVRGTAGAGSSTELLEMVIGKSADAPLCFTCGTKMRPSGACYLCEGCGSTSGCS